MCFPETKRVSLEIPKLNNIESISNYAGYFLAMTFTGYSLNFTFDCSVLLFKADKVK